MAIGRTHGGRLLTIILQLKEDGRMLRPITGWDASQAERIRYQQAGGD